jgi:hypothetical protein
VFTPTFVVVVGRAHATKITMVIAIRLSAFGFLRVSVVDILRNSILPILTRQKSRHFPYYAEGLVYFLLKTFNEIMLV